MDLPLHPIRPNDDDGSVEILDQTRLPHEVAFVTLTSVDAVATAIRTMQVRGAPLIGVTAAWGMALALRADASDAALDRASALLAAQRPTAVNLAWAVRTMADLAAALPPDRRAAAAWREAARITAADEEANRRIGEHGLPLIREVAEANGGAPVNILTHCNAGWLACTAWGTATAPIYLAHRAGIPVHVWVDETRPRNQGASLTAWELARAGVPHTLVVDSAGGHLMQRGAVDLCLVGADRVVANGDVVNKIGTYLKALAAHDTGVPFHVAMPTTTIDLATLEGTAVAIEERHPDEVLRCAGRAGDALATISLAAAGTRAANPAFDVTPARLITSFITERGRSAPTAAGLATLLDGAPA